MCVHFPSSSISLHASQYLVDGPDTLEAFHAPDSLITHTVCQLPAHISPDHLRCLHTTGSILLGQGSPTRWSCFTQGADGADLFCVLHSIVMWGELPPGISQPLGNPAVVPWFDQGKAEWECYAASRPQSSTQVRAQCSSCGELRKTSRGGWCKHEERLDQVEQTRAGTEQNKGHSWEIRPRMWFISN